MDETALLQFLLDASRRGYAAGRSAVKVQEADHSTTIVLEHGKWKFHDNYFGGEPYGGPQGEKKGDHLGEQRLPILRRKQPDASRVAGKIV